MFENFKVNNETPLELGKNFKINRPEDFIQQVSVVSIELFSGSQGDACKLTVGNGTKEVNGLIFNDLKKDATFPNGKSNTIEMQTARIGSIIRQLGAAIDGESFEFSPEKNTFKSIIETLDKKLSKEKKFYIKLDLNKDGFTTISNKGIIFSANKEDLVVLPESIEKLKSKSGIVTAKPDKEVENIEVENIEDLF